MTVVAEKRDATVLRCRITYARTAYRIGRSAPTCQLRLPSSKSRLALTHDPFLSTAKAPSRGVLPRRSSCSTCVHFLHAANRASRSYITNLEDRVEKMEALLKRVRISLAHPPQSPNVPLGLFWCA